METQTVNNIDLHFEHTIWNKELLIWKDEIKFFQNRLEELVVRWTDKTMLVELEQFQNRFIIHKEKIGELMNQITSHEHNLFLQVNAEGESIDRIQYKSHLAFRKNMKTNRNIYNDLKINFFLFLSKYM